MRPVESCCLKFEAADTSCFICAFSPLHCGERNSSVCVFSALRCERQRPLLPNPFEQQRVNLPSNNSKSASMISLRPLSALPSLHLFQPPVSRFSSSLQRLLPFQRTPCCTRSFATAKSTWRGQEQQPQRQLLLLGRSILDRRPRASIAGWRLELSRGMKVRSSVKKLCDGCRVGPFFL